MESEIEELTPQMRTMSMSAIAFINPFRDDPTCDVTEDEDLELSSDDDSNDISDKGVLTLMVARKGLNFILLEITEDLQCSCHNCVAMPTSEESICCQSAKIRPEILTGR